MINHTTFWHQPDQWKVMAAKQLSIYGILTSIYKIYLVMPAPPQFPDAHNVPTLSRLTRPPKGENRPSVTGQRTVAQGWIVTV